MFYTHRRASVKHTTRKPVLHSGLSLEPRFTSFYVLHSQARERDDDDDDDDEACALFLGILRT